jgi:hypothetical protein
MDPDELRPGLPVWAELRGFGWLPARVRHVGNLRGESTRVTVVFESVTRQIGTRTPSYLRKRDPAKRGKDVPRPVRRDRD